jgi:hypothetical protein
LSGGAAVAGAGGEGSTVVDRARLARVRWSLLFGNLVIDGP